MTLLNDQEKLSLIAADFPLAVDPLEGERGAYARQRIKDVLAGHLVHVVSAETYAARCDERDAYFREMMAKDRQNAEDKTTIAKLTADNAALRAAVVHAEDTFDRYARHHRDNGSPEKATHNEWHRDKMTAVLEKGGAGWVSPEEHARVVGITTERLAVHAKAIADDLDAARAEVVQLTADNAALKTAAEQWLSQLGSAGWVSSEEHARVVAKLREDVAAAAGELLVDVPEPGSDTARLLLANVAMRRERDAARARLAATEVDLEKERQFIPNSMEYTARGETIDKLEKRLAEVEAEKKATDERTAALVERLTAGFARETEDDKRCLDEIVAVCLAAGGDEPSDGPLDCVKTALANLRERLDRMRRTTAAFDERAEEAEADLARVKAEAEGLRVAHVKAAKVLREVAEDEGCSHDVDARDALGALAALASPTPAPTLREIRESTEIGRVHQAIADGDDPGADDKPRDGGTRYGPVDTDDISATSVMLKGGAP